MRNWVLRAALLGSLATCGCYTVSYRTSQPAAGRVYEEHENYFICGLVGDNTVDLQRICPDGVARWDNQATVPDSLLACITLDIYTPRTVHVYCAGGRAYELKKNPQTGQMCARRLPEPGSLQ
jgi:hypothetical protein